MIEMIVCCLCYYTCCCNWMKKLAFNRIVYQQLLKTENNKTQIMFFYWLKTVTSCSKFCINITHLNESGTLITVMSEFFFCEGFSFGHVIITTIITANFYGNLNPKYEIFLWSSRLKIDQVISCGATLTGLLVISCSAGSCGELDQKHSCDRKFTCK